MALDGIELRQLLAGSVLLIGLGLAGYGLYMHFSVVGMVQTQHCDGCTPWHPIIVAPIIVGSVLSLTTAGYLTYQRRASRTQHSPS